MTSEQAHSEPADAFEQTDDKSLFWTLSLYIDRASVASVLGCSPTPDDLRTFQAGNPGSVKLRNAMEPLFNDIADRERLGRVDDFLLDAPGPMQGDVITLVAPDHIEWMTEGTVFRATPAGLGGGREVRLRRFWYAHRNGALSYHLSFAINYQHTPGDFYFLSLLQKVVAPKEFSAAPLPKGKRAWWPTDEGSGVFPLENLSVADGDGASSTFWRFVQKRFQADARDMMGQLAASLKSRSYNADAVTFEGLIKHIPFIETPGLEMPLSRFMFFFRDERLFKRLLPPLDANGERQARTRLVQEGCYEAYPDRIQAMLKGLPEDAERKVFLDAAYWEWATKRPEYANLTDDDIRKVQETIPAFERGRADCLQYLFLSGFNQNIVDFMNQDASEVLDSTDPIYPTDAQPDETFFVRFANPRALITYVQRSRSLETGNDYIGTCPYAFLIHVASMHNEFLARDYEEKTYALVGDVRELNRKGRFKKAAQKFYDFRMATYAEYAEHRYPNIFRYDTEGDVFEAMEKLRGTARKDELLEKLVGNTENQTRDLEARISKEDEQLMNRLLGAVGVFGFFQLMFQWAASIEPAEAGGAGAHFSWVFPFLHIDAAMMTTNSGALTVVALVLSMGFSVVMLGFAAYTLGKFLVRKIFG